MENIPKTKIINNQMKKSVCKIILRKENATGFFLEIMDSIKVLITTNNVLDKINSIPNKKINILINGKRSLILIDKERKIYKFLEQNIIMIRIKESDNLDIEYMDVDSEQFSNENKEIYLIHYPKGDEASYTNNIAQKYNENYTKIMQFSTNNQESCCIPLLNSNNNKVMGIFNGKSKSLNLYGILMNGLIQDFCKKYIEYIKVVLVGDVESNKTKIISQIDHNDNYQSTIRAPFVSQSIEYKYFEKILFFEIWDTSGQERYRSLNNIFYKDAKVIFFCYDITNKTSFEDIKLYWYKEVDSCIDAKYVIYAVVGTNADLYFKEEVLEEEGKNFADSINAIFQTISSTCYEGEYSTLNLLERIGKKYIKKYYNIDEDNKQNEKNIKSNDNNYKFELDNTNKIKFKNYNNIIKFGNKLNKYINF